MFKRENYSRRVQSILEIISAYFVDLYYNHFYSEAVFQKTKGKVDSVTDGYKHAVKAHLKSFNNQELYKKTVSGIHKYYYTTTRYSTITFSECINEITSQFVPEEFFEVMTGNQKDAILRTILIDSVTQFSSDILCSRILDIIIDSHDDTSVARTMQDKMVEALMFQREKMFQNFFVSGNRKQSTDYAVINKMKKEMVRLVKENHSAVSKHQDIKSKALKLIDIIRNKDKQLNELKTQNQKLNEELKQHREPSNEKLHVYEKLNTSIIHGEDLKNMANSPPPIIISDNNELPTNTPPTSQRLENTSPSYNGSSSTYNGSSSTYNGRSSSYNGSSSSTYNGSSSTYNGGSSSTYNGGSNSTYNGGSNSLVSNTESHNDTPVDVTSSSQSLDATERVNDEDVPVIMQPTQNEFLTMGGID